MRARKDIVLALRCSATYGEAVDCTGCPYLLEASVEGESWLSCDVDQIALDAAEMLRQDGEEAGRLMSNGDRIRRMSDEELTERLENKNWVCDFDREWCEQRESCENCTAEWIRSPTKEGSEK